MEIKEMNIFQRMSHITNELKAVAKNLNVGTGKSSYKAVGEADVLAAVTPLEFKYGIYSYPIGRKIIESETFEKTSWDNYNKKDKITIYRYFRLETTYRFVNVDNPTDFIDQVSLSDGIDSGDKGTGKAMTYGDKYALLKGYKIITGEDPDQKHSKEIEQEKEDLTEVRKMYNEKCERLGLDSKETQKIQGLTKKSSKDKILQAYGELEKLVGGI